VAYFLTNVVTLHYVIQGRIFDNAMETAPPADRKEIMFNTVATLAQPIACYPPSRILSLVLSCCPLACVTI
jgi:hypothetical protein